MLLQNDHPTPLEQVITVIISTKNRWADLEKALLSLRKQTLQHAVIVMDDNSDDGTSERVKSQFPEVQLHSFAESKGYIIRRNDAIRLAKTPYVVSIDDDCVLDSPTIIYEMADFCIKTQCAAVAWPYIDVNTAGILQSNAPTDELWQACTFKGCAFIVNRKKFLELGGFRTTFLHQGEEEDFCIRLLDSGLPVLLGKGHPVLHFESPRRSFARMDFNGSRNLILFAFFNVPLLFLPVQLAASSVKSILYGFKLKRPYQKTRGVFFGFKDGLKLLRKERKAVSINTFIKYRQLKKEPMKISAVQG